MNATTLEAEWSALRGLTRSTGAACPCRLTASPCPRPDGYRDHGPLLRTLRADHVSLWRAAGRSAAWVSQPYGLDADALAALVGFAAVHRLDLHVGSEPAWHYPGHVLHVELRRTAEGAR